jgi:hypothetical protein
MKPSRRNKRLAIPLVNVISEPNANKPQPNRFLKKITPTDRNNPTDKAKRWEGKRMELIYEELTHELIGCFFD